MPTFSFPSTTEQMAETPKPKNKKSKKEKIVVTKDAEINEQPTTSSSETTAAAAAAETTTTETTVAHPKSPDHRNTENNVNDKPTFPDVVILKQTDKNYIVKHNHYPLHVQDVNSINEHGVAVVSKRASITSVSDDLVSPNQIHKGQINKKRGRKPKAGFILNSNTGMYETSEVPNIILHLKCHLSDLKTNDSISNFDYKPSISDVESYNLSTNALHSSDICQLYNSDNNNDEDNHDNDLLEIENTPNKGYSNYVSEYVSVDTPKYDANTTIAPTSYTAAPPTKKVATEAQLHIVNERTQKEIMKKINRLKYSFHNGETIQMKLNHKCACFWDTCEFDGPIYYIPIMIVNGVFHVSGCFCSPECALAALLKEQMDTSTKFERIHLLHLLYGNSQNKGFKPAPNPNYLLDKYYGNLTIDEYRSLLKGSQMIHIVNKPLTHILPELYEDNNDFLVNSKVIPSNNLKMKKRYKTTLVQSGGAE
jgi:hypothetical protein